MEQDNNWLNELAEPVQQNDTSWLTELAEPVDDWRYNKTESGIPTGDVQSPYSPTVTPETKEPELTQYIDQNIYENVGSFEEGLQLYHKLSNSGTPGVYTDSNGQNWWIPKPQPNMFANVPGVNLLTGSSPVVPDDIFARAGGIVGNTARNVAIGGAALVDKTLGTDTAQSVSDYLPKYPHTGMTKMAEETLGMLIGGQKAFSAITAIPRLAKLTTTIGKSLRTATGVTGAAVAESALSPEDVGSIAGLFNTIDPNDSKADQVLEQKFNTFVDAMALGLTGSVGKEGVRVASAFLDEMIGRKILNFVSKDARQESVINELFDKLSTITGSETPEQRQALMRELASYAQSNKVEVFQIGEYGIKDLPVYKDTISAIEKGILNKQQAVKDGIADKMPFENSDDVLTLLREARKEIMGKDIRGLLEGKVNSINKQTDALRDAIYTEGDKIDEMTGASNMEKTLSGVQDLYDEKVDYIRRLRGNTQDLLDTEKENLQKILKNYPVDFAKDMNKKFEKIGINIHMDKNDTFDVMVNKLTTLKQVMTKQRDDLYNAIPDDAYIDMEMFEERFVEAVKVGKEFELSIPFLPKDLSDKIIESEGNFKVLYNEVLPALSRLKNKAYDTRNNKMISDIESLREFIREDSLEYLIKSGQKDAADAATTALDYYRKDYATIWKRGELERFGDAVDGLKFDPVDAKTEMNTRLSTMLRPDQTEFFDHLVESLSIGNTTGDKNLPVQYILKNAETELLSQMMNGKSFDDVMSGPIFNNLAKYSRQLENNNPELKSLIDGFSNSLRKRYSNIADLEGQLKQSTKELKEIENQVYEGEAKEFFKKEGSVLGIRKENPMESFQELFNGTDNKSKITRIVAAVQTKPNRDQIMAGLQSAYIKHLHSKLTMTQKTLSGQRKISIPQYDKLLQKGLEGGTHPLLEYGDIIFADKPAVHGAVRELLKTQFNISQSLKATSSSGGINLNTASIPQSFKQVGNFFITQIWGPLNRFGARVRAGMGQAVEGSGIVFDANLMIEKIYSDPDYFNSIITRMTSEPEKKVSAIRKAELLSQWLVKMGVFGTSGSGAPYEGDLNELKASLSSSMANIEYNQEKMNSTVLEPESWSPENEMMDSLNSR